MKNTIHESVEKFAREFTEMKINRRTYAARGQTDPKKIYDDCYMGKLAEFAAWKYLCGIYKNGQPVCRPDKPPLLDVLDRPNWDADLKNARYKFAVKSVKQNIAEQFGLSWTFNLKPRDQILDICDVMYKVIFVVSKSAFTFEIYGVSHTQALKTSGAYTFVDGVDLPKLKGIKLFVHADKVQPGVIIPVRKEIYL